MTKSWTANQLVAYNLRQAREEHGLTQKQAAERLAPYLGGKPWSVASFSAAESTARNGARTREFSANELLAFSRAFERPVAYFLTPPIGEPTYRPVSCGGDVELGLADVLEAVAAIDSSRVRSLIESLPKSQRRRFTGTVRSVAYARVGQAGLRNVTEHAANLRRLANDLEAFDDRVQDELTLALGEED